MKPDNQLQINAKLTEAAGMVDASVTLMCEATIIAVSGRDFVYAETLIHGAQALDYARGGCLARVVDPKVFSKISP